MSYAMAYELGRLAARTPGVPSICPDGVDADGWIDDFIDALWDAMEALKCQR